MAVPLTCRPEFWYSVDIPKDIQRSTSVGDISDFIVRIRFFDAKILIHFTEDEDNCCEKAYFRYIYSCTHLGENHEEKTEIQEDNWNTCIVQYRKPLLYCISKTSNLRAIFPPNLERKIKYTDLTNCDNVVAFADLMKSEVPFVGDNEEREVSLKASNLKGLHGYQKKYVEMMLHFRTSSITSIPSQVTNTKTENDESKDSVLGTRNLTVEENTKGSTETVKNKTINVARETWSIEWLMMVVVDDASVEEHELPDSMFISSEQSQYIRSVPKVKNNKEDDGTYTHCDASCHEEITKIKPRRKEKKKRRLCYKNKRNKWNHRKRKCQTQYKGIKQRRNLQIQKEQDKQFTYQYGLKEHIVDKSYQLEEVEIENSFVCKKYTFKIKHTPLKKSRELNEKKFTKLNDEDKLESKELIKENRPLQQKGAHRLKPWSWNSMENLKQKYIAAEDSGAAFLYRKSDKYSIEISELLRYFTTQSRRRKWRVDALVYPSKRSKSSKGTNRRSQGRTHSSQSQEGIPDQYPTQVSDAASSSLSLPHAEEIVTSAQSAYRPFSTSSPAPTTSLTSSLEAERGLMSRIRGDLPQSRFSRAAEPPRHPQYRELQARQRSYTNWPSGTGQDSLRLASYGFFYTGRFDLIRCFQCGIGLKDWAAADEPLFEHIKHSGECPFLRDLLGPELLKAYKENLLNNQRPSTAGSGTAGGIRNPQYADLQARLDSFDKWPTSSPQRPHSLADAGLFYTGQNDLCRCFTCDGGLQRWDVDDDPWIEHARWFPQCPYVRQIKGQDFINMVQQAAAQARQENEDPAVVYPPPGSGQGERPIVQAMQRLGLNDSQMLNTFDAQRVVGMGYSKKAVLLAIHEFNGQAHGERNDFTAGDLVRILTEKEDRGEALPPDSPTHTYQAPIAALSSNMDPEEENQRLRGILKCLRCEVNDTNILFLPCTHHRLCEDCALDVKICPICGREIKEKIKTYMS